MTVLISKPLAQDDNLMSEVNIAVSSFRGGRMLLPLLVRGGGEQETDESEGREGNEPHDEDGHGDLLSWDSATGLPGTR
jgi:hypothetical protein